MQVSDLNLMTHTIYALAHPPTPTPAPAARTFSCAAWAKHASVICTTSSTSADLAVQG